MEDNLGTGTSRPSGPRLWAVALGAAFCLLAAAALYVNAAATFAGHRDFTWFEGSPLLTNLDGYYYLRLAEDLQEGRYAPMDELRGLPRPMPVPLLVRALSAASAATGLSLRFTAYCLPPFLALFMVGVYFAWGLSLGGVRPAVLASLAGMAAPYWFLRTVPGRLDTDCLNPVFFYLILFLAMRFALCRENRRYLYLALALLLGGLFQLWWSRFGILAIGVAGLFYGFSLFVPSSRAEKRVKLAVLILAALALAVPMFGLEGMLPTALREAYTTVGGHIDLITKQQEGAWFRTGESVDELVSMGLPALGRQLSGNPLIALCALAGLGLLVARRPATALFLAGGGLVGVFGLIAARFLIFLIPLFAVGLAFFVEQAFFRGVFAWIVPRRRWSGYAAWAVGFAALLPALVGAVGWNAPPPADAGQAFLAREAAKGSRPGDMIWCWWDFGYFMQYFAGRPTFIDGGMVSADRLYVSSFALYADNPVLAANWMRFFSAHGMNGLERVRASVGNVPGADAYLKLALAGPGGPEKAAERFPLADAPALQAALFPQASPMLVMSTRILDYSLWWGRYGALDLESGQLPEPEVYRIPLAAGAADLERGVVHLKEKEAGLKWAARPTPQGLLHGKMRPDGEYVAVVLDHVGNLYLMENALGDSLAVRLLFLAPEATPGFAPIYYNPLLGGVWKAA